MKFTGALSTLLVVLPFLVLQGSAAPAPFGGNDGNGRGFFGRGRNGNNNQNGKNGKGAAGAGNGGAAASNSTATASNGTAAGGVANTGAGAGAANGTAAAGNGNEQTSLTLDPAVIGSNLAQDGTASATEGETPSLTSTNNFINSCVGKTITNGLQVQGGSCNPVPMGDLPAKTVQPTSKFVIPTNMQNFGVNQAFTVTMAINNLNTGNFVNPNTNYFAAPQQLDGTGTILGHSHFVIQSLPSVTSTQPLDPTVFAFFQGLNGKASGGQLTGQVSKGLPAGAYRVFSINTAANHQPVLGPVAQHGSFDDAVYFTVGAAANQAAMAAIGAAGNNGTAAAAAAPPAAAPPAAAPPAANNGTAAAAPATPPAQSGAAAPAAPPAAKNGAAAPAAPPAAKNGATAAPPAAAGANAGGAGAVKAKGGRRSF